MVACFMIAGRRPFNFDEFQVLYASASIVRGKAYFAGQIETHFPLSNILMSFLLTLTGFKASALLIARYVIFAVNGLTLFYVYRIASRLWSRNAGLLAIALTLSTVVYLEKGLEVRHDVFNTLFNVMAAYYGMRFLSTRRGLHLVLFGLLLGMAIASTQKAVIWSFGIAFGLMAALLREGAYKDTGKTLFSLVGLVPIPLALSLIGLLWMVNEELSLFFHRAVFNTASYLNPHGKDLFPFPHDRFQLLQEIGRANLFFFSLGIGGLIAFVLQMRRSSQGNLVLSSWCFMGLLFYLTMRRPFFQSLLPTIPPLAIVVSSFLLELRDALRDSRLSIKMGIFVSCFIVLFLWPFHFIIPKTAQSDQIERQLFNTAFCLANLKEGEKVLCFTQNQVFFDPLLPKANSSCGDRFYSYDPDCFKRKMIDEQCRVVIYDYRTRLMNKKILKMIQQNYLPTKRGHILIPGFEIEPHGVLRKELWVEGYYYSPTLSLEVDGRKIRERLVRLRKGTHRFFNLSGRPLRLVYIFNPENFIEENLKN